jgi:hypothetical protein
MSHTPSVLAVIAIRPKKEKNKKISCMPSCLAVVAIGQKKGKTKNVRLVWLWLSTAKKRKNKKRHARHLFWPWLPSGQKRDKNEKCHTPHLVCVRQLKREITQLWDSADN